MYAGLKIAAVLPAYNEAKYIKSALEKLPRDIFDDLIVVDDTSQDDTVAEARAGGATHVIEHPVNRGVGGAIKTGFFSAVQRGNDVAVVIPGDGQADLQALPRMLDKVKEGYGLVISDRLSGRDPTEWGMPKYRLYGSKVLAVITWLVSGIYVPDPQSGYKAITKETIQTIPLEKIYERWGVHNDFLSFCGIHDIPVTTVRAEPVYMDDEGERIKSHFKVWHILPRHAVVFSRAAVRRVVATVGKRLKRH